MLQKVCGWSRLISACSQYIWPRLLDCSYAADTFGGMGTVVQLCSWPKQLCSWLLCGWAELLGAFDGMSTIVKLTKAVVFLTVKQWQSTNAAWSLVLSSSFGVLAAWCSWCHEQSRSFMGAASECCPGQLPNTLRACTLAHYLLEAVVQKIQLNLVLVCTILMLCKDNF